MLYNYSSWLHRVAALLFVLSASVRNVHAFFPTTWRQKNFGSNGVSHEQQTQLAFQTVTRDHFPDTKKLSRAMTKARDNLALANANVDNDFDHSAYHCDGENFDGAQTRLTELRSQVVLKLRNGLPDAARLALGSALHTVQDFYSHSNWVELGNTKPHPDLGRDRPIAHAPFENATCFSCGPTRQKDADGCPVCQRNTNEISAEQKIANDEVSADQKITVFSESLTSGYAFKEDRPVNLGPIPENKCHHGGFIDNPKGAIQGFIGGILYGDSMPGINKDSLNCGFSPHFQHHRTAVDLAVAASIQFINDIRPQVTENQFRQLLGVGRTYAFMLDTTMRLPFSLDGMKNHTKQIIEDDLEDKDASQYVVVDAQSPSATVRTMDVEQFKSSVDNLEINKSSFGFRCLGIQLQSILDTVKSLDEGSNLFLLAGAFPPDDELTSQIISLSYEKDIRIHSFQYLGCNPVFTWSPARFQEAIAASPYQSLATATGGHSYSFPSSDSIPTWTAVRNKELSKRQTWEWFSNWWSKGDGGRILRIVDSLKPLDRKTYTFPVDKSVTELKVSVSSKSLTTVTLITPRGAIVPLIFPNPPGVSYVKMDGGHFMTIKAPGLLSTGKWIVNIEGTKDFSLNVYGTSTLHLASFDFTAIRGRPGHQGFFPIIGPPAPNSDISATAGLSGDFSNATFEFRSPNGDVVYPAPLRPGSGALGEPPKSSFHGVVRLAARKEYHVYVTGTDSTGQAFQRVWPTVVVPN